MRIRLLSFIVVLLSFQSHSQVEYSRSLPGGRIYGQIHEAFNFDLVLGYKYTGSNFWTTDFGAMRLEPNGQLDFHKLFVDSDSSNFLEPSICSDPFGNTYLTSTQFSGNVQLLVKLDPNGNVLWQKDLETSGMLYAPEHRMLADSNKLFVIGEYRQGNSYAVYYQTLTLNGQLLSSKRISPFANPPSVNYLPSQPQILELENSDLLVFTKHFNGSGQQTNFLTRLSKSGSVVWSKNIDLGAGATEVDVALLPSGNIVCLSARIVNFAQPNKQTVMLMKFSPTGTLLDSRHFQHPVSSAGLESNTLRIVGDTISIFGTYWPAPYSNYPNPFWCTLDSAFNVQSLKISADTADVLFARTCSDNAIAATLRGFTGGVFGYRLDRFVDHSTACGANYDTTSWQYSTVVPQVSNVVFSTNSGSIDTANIPFNTLSQGPGSASCVSCTVPVAGFSFSGVSPIQFSNSSSAAGSYVWSFGDGTTSTAANPHHLFPAAGTYSVTLTASNGCGSDTEVQSVTFNPPPIAGFTYGILSQGLQFADSSFYADTAYHHWDFGDGSTSSEVNPSHVFQTSGNYAVCLTVQNSVGSDTSCQSVMVDCDALITPFIAGFDSTDLFTAFNFSFNVDSSYWLLDGSLAATGDTLIHLFDDTLLHEVCQVLSHFCGIDTLCAQYKGKCTLPEVSIADSNSAAIFYFSGVVAHADSVIWNFGDGVVDTALNPIHIYSTSGLHTVTLAAFNRCGFTIDSIQVDVPVGVEAIVDERAFTVYRSYDQLIIHVLDRSWLGATVEVMDLSGRILWGAQLKAEMERLPLRNTPNQVLIISVTDNNRFFRSKIGLVR